MSYLRHSFTLPHRKKEKVQERPTPQLTSSRSELVLYRAEKTGAEYYGIDRLEDAPSRYVQPDFYGGYPLPEESRVPEVTCSPQTSSIPLRRGQRACQTLNRKKSDGSYLRREPPPRETLSSKSPVHCCCSNGGVYRVNLHCCHQMEPLWEAETAVNFRPTNGTVNWYDRKLRHRSCPSFQVSFCAMFCIAVTIVTCNQAPYASLFYVSHVIQGSGPWHRSQVPVEPRCRCHSRSLDEATIPCPTFSKAAIVFSTLRVYNGLSRTPW